MLTELRYWLRTRLTPEGRYELMLAREHKAAQERAIAYLREHADEIRARAPRRVIVIEPKEGEALRCAGQLYVSGGVEEHAIIEWSYVVRAECNAGPGGDCGFNEDISEQVCLEGKAWGITTMEMADLQTRHLKHSRGEG